MTVKEALNKIEADEFRRRKELIAAMDEGFEGSPHQRAGYPKPSESGKLVQEYFEDQDRHKQHQSPIAPEHGGYGSEYDEAMEGGRR